MALTANRADHLEGLPAPASAAARRRFVSVLVACLVLHGVGIAVLIFGLPFLATPPEPEPIAVELVEEPPPPEQPSAPEPPQPEPKEQPKSAFYEAPVTDAPRAADQEVQDTNKDKASTAPVQAPKVEQKPTQAASAQPPQQVEPVETGETSSAPLQESAPPSETALPQPKPAKSIAEQMAALQPLPDLQFEAPAKRSNLPRGTADPGYLSTLFGMIMQQMKFPPNLRPSDSLGQGLLLFTVDARGRVVKDVIALSSGSAELDAAARDAVRKAAPYPPPPAGAAMNVRFGYSAK